MSFDHILGIIIIAIAYGTLWYFVLYGRRIIDNIHDKGLENLREIKRELGLKREKNG
jgi:proline racemase